MEEIMMRKMLEEVNPHYRELIRKFDEKVRRWKKEEGSRRQEELAIIVDNFIISYYLYFFKQSTIRPLLLHMLSGSVLFH
jgi:hypothetical protein